MSLTQAGLLDLPRELLLECSKYLDYRTLVRCTEVCKTLRQSIKESLELQYLIELGADGLIEGVGCTLPTSERLKLLLQRRARWRYLNWTHIIPIAAPALCQAYELVDGVFASSMGNGFSGSRHLQLTWLPTSTDEATRTIERDDLGVQMRDFAIDPSQDLMALVIADDVASHLVGLSFTIRLRTISGNKPHPQARVPQLQAPVPFQVGNSFVQIVDDVVGAFFWVRGPGLIIWNWRTGKIVVNCIGFDLPTGAYDFAFISNRAYMITVTTNCGSIALYTFSDANEDNPSSSAPQSPSIDHRLLPTQIAILSLPPTNPGVALQRFLTHAAPFVANPTPGRMFETSRDAHVHIMSLFYGDPSRDYHLFLHNRFLLSHIPPGVGSGEGVKVIEKQWDDWGPDNTRFVNWITHFQWLRYLHGQRVMFPPIPLQVAEAEADGDGEMVMLMIDFNVHPKRLDDPVDATGNEMGGEGSAKYEIVNKEHTTAPEDVFEYPVISRLPYAVSTRKGVRDVLDYTGFMIDQDRLIGMRSGDEGYVNLEVSRLLHEAQQCAQCGPIGTPRLGLGATAHHVLGQSSVTLGAGDLNLLPAPVGSKHDLMLTVGSAGFSLHHDTTFGTLESDSRAYVFSPEIEGVQGGFVKITLPEGVEEDASRLSALQTKFEQVLIAHGLLQPGGNDPSMGLVRMYLVFGTHHSSLFWFSLGWLGGTEESLVNIPRCIAAQILGEEIAILSEGTLSLVVVPKSEMEDEAVLTLTVGKSAFPLYKNTLFGTLADDSRTYVFNPVSEGTSEGLVAIVLPEADAAHGASLDLPSPQNELELVLVEYGLLKDGIEAAADEVARSIHEDSTRTAQRLREVCLRSAEFSSVADNVSRGAERGIQSMADVAHGVSGTVLGVALVAGALVTNALAPSEAAESTRGQLSAPARRTTSTMQPDGVVVGEVKDASHDTGGEMDEDDYESKARYVAGTAGQDMVAPSAVDADMTTGTSEQNEKLRAEEGGGKYQGQHAQDEEDLVDMGML
ncbi:hypothetical protein LXA43DRAFT_1081303 [Ganoderma leucocontextum]|nr:hypothetical protein LXA43DRAFT_1081303 [Ganoderma leucocontextum]